MKKAVLILAALLMVVSGVAAVSAYEAHVVNVKATVENALTVTLTDEDQAAGGLDFGTVFPEEWLSKHFRVERSTSFIAQSRVDSVDFEVWAESKAIPQTSPVEYYPWLGDAVYVKVNGSEGYVGAAPAGTPPVATPVKDYSGATAVPMIGTINGTSTQLQVYVWLDVPVFFDYYNSLTDVPDKPRDVWADIQLAGYMGSPATPASVMGIPSMILPTGLGPSAYAMGVDLKIQVVDIYKE